MGQSVPYPTVAAAVLPGAPPRPLSQPSELFEAGFPDVPGTGQVHRPRLGPDIWGDILSINTQYPLQ